MAFKFRVSRPKTFVDPPGFPQISAHDEDEPLMGEVQGKTASEGEERLARELQRAGIQFEFRMVVGAPKGMPGWKELDFLVQTRGLMYAVEVDTAFTHRNKDQSDRLHDAIILNDREINTYGELYPQVLHVDGEQDLANTAAARAYVRRQFGKG